MVAVAVTVAIAIAIRVVVRVTVVVAVALGVMVAVGVAVEVGVAVRVAVGVGVWLMTALQRLSELRKLAEGATPGPWTRNRSYQDKEAVAHVYDWGIYPSKDELTNDSSNSLFIASMGTHGLALITALEEAVVALEKIEELPPLNERERRELSREALARIEALLGKEGK